MSVYSRRNYSDSDDDRYKLSSSSAHPTSSRGGGGGYSNSYSSSNYNDSRADSRYTSYRNPRNDRSDSEDNAPASSRYGASTRRNVRYSSDSDDDKFDKNRRGGISSSRPMTSSRRDYDSDSYDGANQKLKSLMSMEKKLADEIDEIDELINLRDKKIEQLKAEIQRDLAKKKNSKSKLDEVRAKRKALQYKLDEYK